MLQDNSFDWAMGEAVAFGSLLMEGFFFFLTRQYCKVFFTSFNFLKFQVLMFDYQDKM